MPSKVHIIIIITVLSYALSSCGIYGFKGISIPAEINTYLVEDFNFTDVQCETGIEQDFSEALRRKIRDESRLVKPIMNLTSLLKALSPHVRQTILHRLKEAPLV